MLTNESALAALWPALQAHARHVLIDLRDRPDEDGGAVEAWAQRYDLSSPQIMDAAQALRDWWPKNPRAAEDLRCAAIIYLTGSWRPHNSAEADWLARNTHHTNLPDPSTESLRRWLQRATTLYREREHLTGRYRNVARTNLDKHCRWFVDIHVNDIKLKDLARDMQVEIPAIDAATKKVAQLLGVRRRTRGLGRPLK